MDITTLTPVIPLWAVFIGSFLIVFLSIFLGFRIGAYHKRHADGQGEAPIGAVVGATLGLLAF
ncbi:MAG: hypothetical protein L0213_07625, partial [Candidatus Dadabacteria bacterium]|nr:hypothetical protein [Candidatus Dadabacteria bacterium]